MVLLQIRTTPLGQGLPSLAMLQFNHPLHGIMPALDRKPVSVDNDDEHHKKLKHRQGKNNPNNDTSQVFASNPIGSTAAVQWEDRGLWTHGTIVGTGNHNHHSRSYKIQVTTTGRIITCNIQHIKPTSITAEDYMHYQARKHTKMDPLDAILDHIQKTPHSYTNKATSNKGGTIKIHMVKSGLETIHKAVDRNK